MRKGLAQIEAAGEEHGRSAEFIQKFLRKAEEARKAWAELLPQGGPVLPSVSVQGGEKKTCRLRVQAVPVVRARDQRVRAETRREQEAVEAVQESLASLKAGGAEAHGSAEGNVEVFQAWPEKRHPFTWPLILSDPLLVTMRPAGAPKRNPRGALVPVLRVITPACGNFACGFSVT